MSRKDHVNPKAQQKVEKVIPTTEDEVVVDEVVESKDEADEVDDYLNQLAEETIDAAETPKEIAKPKKEKKEKAPKGEGTPRGPKVTDPNLVTPAQLAETLGTDPRSLRMFLRAHFTREDNDKNKSWSWAKGSKQLQEIIDAWNAKGVKVATPKVEKVVPATGQAAPVETAKAETVATTEKITPKKEKIKK